jgi:hypothetical protein
MVGGLAQHHRRTGGGRHGNRPYDVVAERHDARSRDLRDPRFVGKALAQALDAHRQAVAVIGRIAQHEAGRAQGLEDAIRGGPRQPDFLRNLGDRGAVAQVEHCERVKTAHQRTDRSCGFHETSRGGDDGVWVSVRATTLINRRPVLTIAGQLVHLAVNPIDLMRCTDTF